MGAGEGYSIWNSAARRMEKRMAVRATFMSSSLSNIRRVILGLTRGSVLVISTRPGNHKSVVDCERPL